MKIGIIHFPNSDQSQDVLLRVQRVGLQPVLLDFASQPNDEYAGFIIVGELSNDIYSRDAAMASAYPFFQTLKTQKNKPILGIGIGAEILVELGLVPGVENDRACMGILSSHENTSSCIQLTHQYQLNMFTKHLFQKNILTQPADASFVIPPALLIEMKTQGLNVFEYDNGEIAAVSNKTGNVLAMIPYPNDDSIFIALREATKDGYEQKVAPLFYYPRVPSIKKFKAKHREYFLEIKHPALIEKLFSIKIKRYMHWEMDPDTLNPLNELLVKNVHFNEDSKKYLVRLKNEFSTEKKLQTGIIWEINADSNVIKKIFSMNILFNSVIHNCYEL